MVANEICPTKTQLTNLIEGKLLSAEEAEVVRHIEQCDKCQQALEQLAPSREELLPAQVNGAALQFESREQVLKRVMQSLQAEGCKEVETECMPLCDDDFLRILSPSGRPDGLGRIGAYEVTGIIGRGGMGAVFKAIDTTLDRIVAVKILAPALSSHGTARQRFVREARSAAAVVHDHVITIHAVDQLDGQPYLVMQFVPGISLQEKIDRTGPLELKEILRIARQIASGLAAAHGQGLVHRDIKPSNVLLENGVERVKITDFGLARAVDDASITRSAVIAGTPQYMAPEQANGEPVDHRADLFSLGSVMYAMCTGRPPFRAESTMATLRCVCDKQPRPIPEVNSDIPEWLVQFIARLHEKEPAARFQSAVEVEHLLADRLASIQRPAIRSDPEPLDATPGEGAKDEPAKQNRSPSPVVIAAGLGFLLLLGLSVSELVGATNIIEALATVFRIEMPAGTVVIEVDDPNARVTLDGEEISVGTDGFRELRLKPGSYEFGTMRDGVLKSQRIIVTQGSKEVVRVGFENRTVKQGQEPKPETAQQKRKAQERAEILRQRLELLEQQYLVGNTTIDRVHRASNDLLAAELELATSTEDRIRILEKQLANLESLEAVTQRLYEVGKCGQEDVLGVRADRIEAETRLNRERGNSGDISTRPAVQRLSGVVEYDGRRITNIFARLDARLERVYVDQVGVAVKKGDALVTLQSAVLYSAEQEFLQARKSGQEPLVRVAREKLSLLGLTTEQIGALEQKDEDEATGRLTLYAPTDGIVTASDVVEGASVKEGSPLFSIADPTLLWIKLDAPEADLKWLRLDQSVTLTTVAYPGTNYVGKIAFIAPHVDPLTRKVTIRVDLMDPEQKLRPGMTVHGAVQKIEPGTAADAEYFCPMHPTVMRAEPGNCPVCNMRLSRREGNLR